jgi:hypothetical protein
MPKIKVTRQFLGSLIPPENFPRPREPVLIAERGAYQLFAHRTGYGAKKSYFVSVDGLRTMFWPQAFNIMPRAIKQRVPPLNFDALPLTVHIKAPE